MIKKIAKTKDRHTIEECLPLLKFLYASEAICSFLLVSKKIVLAW